MTRFLRFAVERTLEGRGDELKEYLVGVEVFDRKDSYDPRVDPIVRVEARRLRSKLKAYYETDGAGDAIVIEFASGSYVAQFRAAVAAEPSPLPASSSQMPAVNIAVLPFVNLSGNSEYQYFSDGLTEELIHSLTRFGGMRVVVWNTAAQLRERQQDIAGIHRELNVGTALTGSVRISGCSLRVRAQLIDAESGVYLWSETFDRQMEDVFAIQQEIALAIVRTLRVQFAGRVNNEFAGRQRTNIGSYDWYLKGRYCWNLRTPDSLAHSIQCFESALAIEPQCAPACAGLADAWTLMVDYGMTHPSEGMPKAKAAAARAIELDPELGEAYASMALIRGLYEWQWDEAEALYHRALTLNPGYATAHHWLAVDQHAMVGRLDEALLEIGMAIDLDPLSSIIQEGRAYILMLQRRYAESIEAYRRMAIADPGFYKAYTSMGRALAQQGDYEEAIAMLQKGRSMAGDLPAILGAIGQVYGLAGGTARARAILAELAELAKRRYVPSTCFAVVHLGLGEIGLALEWLEKGCAERELPMTAIKVHPAYDALRGESRFQAILKRMRLK